MMERNDSLEEVFQIILEVAVNIEKSMDTKIVGQAIEWAQVDMACKASSN